MNDAADTTTDTANTAYPTELGRSRDGFAVQVMLHSLETGLRTPEDFIRHFPPTAIMEALKDRAMLRAKILVDATGTREKIALKMDAVASGTQLQIALDEGVTTPDQIVQLFEPDERVRYLARPGLWAYEIKSEYWKKSSKDKEDFERAKAHVSLILRAALDNHLVSRKDIVDALTVKELVNKLPKDELLKLISTALQIDRKFDEDCFLEAVPPDVLVKHVPLPTIWEQVVVPLVADAHGFIEKPPAPEETPAPTPPMRELLEEDDAPKA